MQTNIREQFAIQFADCMARLKKLGLVGEVSVNAGVVMLATTDRNSASQFRRACKTAAQNSGAIFCENRPAKGAYVFTLAC